MDGRRNPPGAHRRSTPCTVESPAYIEGGRISQQLVHARSLTVGAHSHAPQDQQGVAPQRAHGASKL